MPQWTAEPTDAEWSEYLRTLKLATPEQIAQYHRNVELVRRKNAGRC